MIIIIIVDLAHTECHHYDLLDKGTNYIDLLEAREVERAIKR